MPVPAIDNGDTPLAWERASGEVRVTPVPGFDHGDTARVGECEGGGKGDARAAIGHATPLEWALVRPLLRVRPVPLDPGRPYGDDRGRSALVLVSDGDHVASGQTGDARDLDVGAPDDRRGGKCGAPALGADRADGAGLEVAADVDR